MLSQIILKPNYDAVEHEALKASIHSRAATMDPYTISTESVHYTAFRVSLSPYRTITSASPQLETRTLFTPLLLNKSSSTITIFMLERISSSVVQVI